MTPPAFLNIPSARTTHYEYKRSERNALKRYVRRVERFDGGQIMTRWIGPFWFWQRKRAKYEARAEQCVIIDVDAVTIGNFFVMHEIDYQKYCK